MPSFDARLRLPGQTKIPVSVVVDISDERLKLTSGERVLGDWPLDQISVVSLPDGFHLNLEGEEIVLSVSEPSTFFGYLHNGRVQSDVLSVNGGRATDSAISNRLKLANPDDGQADMRVAIDKLAAALLEEDVPPNRVFATWLHLLKELNRRHGQGQIDTPLFYRFNTELLDMLPSPNHETV